MKISGVRTKTHCIDVQILGLDQNQQAALWSPVSFLEKNGPAGLQTTSLKRGKHTNCISSHLNLYNSYTSKSVPDSMNGHLKSNNAFDI